MRFKLAPIFILCFCISLSGCAKLISDYDPATAQAIGATAKSIDFFYGSLNLKKTDTRKYANFTTETLQVDVAFNALNMHAGMQSSNQETLKMIENALKLWTKYKDKFQKSDSYSDTKLRLHKKRLHKMFEVMLKAELSKK